MSPRELRADFESAIRRRGFPPDMLGTVLSKELNQSVRLTSRNHFAEYVLLDGMCPLRHV
jgi:hypothetical protein